MQNIYQTLKLSWEEIGTLVGQMISGILGWEITCRAGYDAHDFWTVSTIAYQFSVQELEQLLDYVGADSKVRSINIPEDADSASSLDVELSRALLKEKLKTTWVTEHITDDGLWLVGIDSTRLGLPKTINIYGRAIGMHTLWPKDELVEQLFDAGGTEANLSSLCERYVKKYGNQLYWSYPISDGEYNGVYFVLVQEGILCLPYDEIDKDEYEIFEEDGVRLLSAEDMGYFIEDWKRASSELENVMDIFKNYLKARGDNVEET